ncbi:MAG: zinc ribbon domain-containing protein [Desulfobacterales bacterium]|nr:zinc ribbon domain-containing protein [Desulfobacterales bacterium]
MFETKEQVFEKIMEQEKPVCPHCGQEMSIWEIPPIAVGDGLGWDSPYMYVCFNDQCPLFTEGWENMWENYSQQASYRCIKSPYGSNFELMPVFSSMGGQGQIVDDEVVAAEERLKEAIKKGFSILSECYVSSDSVTCVQMLLDPSEPARVRLKAAEMTGDIAGLEALEVLNNRRFGNELLQEKSNEAIAKIHERHFTRECPFCAEIIKKRAKICKHCGKDVAGV